ncbi:MAG: hypothetical protein QJR14_09520 [Bacillota bacterium]|nr:hypothetical protein [Bacillota bacterium]
MRVVVYDPGGRLVSTCTPGRARRAVRRGRAVWRGAGAIVLLTPITDAETKERAAEDPRTARALRDAVAARVRRLREVEGALALVGARPAAAVAEAAGLPWPGPAELWKWGEADWAAWGAALLAALDDELRAAVERLMAAPLARKRHRTRTPWRTSEGRTARAAAAGGGEVTKRGPGKGSARRRLGGRGCGP